MKNFINKKYFKINNLKPNIKYQNNTNRIIF